MATILFVHGTGVRQTGFDATMSAITGEVKAELPGIGVKPCFWGDRFGVRLHHEGRSIPEYDTARGAGDPEPVESEAAGWARLLEDPYFELRLLIEIEGDFAPVPGNQLAPGEQLLEAVKAIDPAATEKALPTPEWQRVYREALDGLVTDPAFEELLLEIPSRDQESELAVARAIVAAAMARGAADQFPALDGPLRDRLVVALTSALGEGRRAGMLGRLARPLMGFATRWASRRRGRISDAVLEEPGDILLYQARGAPIRQFIRDAIDGCEDDVFVFAHSLGGIMAVDLLAAGEVARVKGLITVGSQAPFLYETGALVTLSPQDSLPAHFPPWLNVYDKSDFLSYLAAKVFANPAAGAASRIFDFEAVSRQPFPQSHSAYFTNPAVWRRIATFVTTLT